MTGINVELNEPQGLVNQIKVCQTYREVGTESHGPESGRRVAQTEKAMKMGKQLLALAMGTLLSTSASADIKNKYDMFAFFDTDSVSKLWTGGGASDYRKYVSLDYANIVGGGTIDLEEIEPIFQAVTGGNGTKEEHGLEGVTLNFVTSDSFSISYPGAADTTETVVFLGDYVQDIISTNATGNIDIKNKKSNFAMMNTDSKSNISIGGGKDDARKIVSEEFAELTGGSKIDRDKKGKKEVELLFSESVVDKQGGWNSEKGVNGVEIIGLTNESFSASMNGASISTDRIVFDGSYVLAAIKSTDRGLVDTKDPNSSFAIVDTTSVFLGGAVESVSPEFKELVGNKIYPDEAEKVFKALTENNKGGINGVKLIGVNHSSFAIELDSSGPGKEVILFQGAEAELAVANRLIEEL